MRFVFEYLAAGTRQYFRSEEAAILLGVHISSIRRWTKNGRLPVLITPGGHRRISREALLKAGATYNVP